MTGNPSLVGGATASGQHAADFGVLIFQGGAGAGRRGAGLRAAGGRPGLRVVHQTGAEAGGGARRVRRRRRQADVRRSSPTWVPPMPLPISSSAAPARRRSPTRGARQPAVLVPYRYAADDHQRANAESLVHAGAARMVLDADASAERLAAEVRALHAPAVRAEMAARMQALARPDAAERVLETLDELIRRRRGDAGGA
jgi:UDP-N-acetylglucosamine--N-acetylmuramyl-(pentapeptide) pyrophosphoryl-undecaprenol N-acetylglucosamine transferase